MTSTNDGKDVKSNQTSGQKGKTYYIELYKSLEARLSGECTGEQRARLVCEAWRRVHSLCEHSAQTTHPHLLAWLQRHTSHTILQTEWQSPKSKDQHVWLEEAIDAFIGECHTAASTRSASAPSWESQLLHRAQWFKTVLSNPWGHPVLKALLDSRGNQPTDEEVLGWLKEERGVMFVTRLRQLAAAKCDDLALLLAAAVMSRARDCTVLVPDVEQATDLKSITDQSETFKSGNMFVDILRKEAGFTVDVWELLTDIEFVLLHKGESRSRCIELAKQTPLRNGYQLVERLHSRLEMSPRDKKLWKNAKDVATLIAQVVIARCMVVPVCAGVARIALYGCARSLVRLLPPARLPPAAAALAAPAATSRHLHTLATAIRAQCNEERKSFVCELYVRAITAGMNELERLKLKTEKESEARSAEQTLSTWFIQLGTLLTESSRLNCECLLTAFSVHPSSLMYDWVKNAPQLAPILKDIQEPGPETNSEFGSWATDSRTQTNLVKTSETLNLKQTQKQANVLSTAIFAEGEALGLGAELCQDLAVLISGPRVKTLSWDMDRELLLENCRTYMERTHGGTRALTTELKYLNLDPRSFQHLPEEDDEENNAFYGIEKGYEHLVEFQEPEEMWHDAITDDSDKTDSASSIDELPIVIPRRKKKSRRLKYSSDEETDPLSLVSDTKRTNKKERPHSKERSKEMKEKKHKNKIKEQPTKDTEHSKIVTEITNDMQKKEKKKERKERKKKEKAENKVYETQHQRPLQGGSLSRLVGMKVARIPGISQQLKKSDSDTNINNNSCVTDSDYDSQGKSSMTSINSEGNDADVLFDGLFSMDEIKSPEKISIDAIQRPSMPKTEEPKVTSGIIVNTRAPQQIYNTHALNQQQQLNLQSSTRHDILAQNNTSNDVREEVKKSIKKLIQFRRNKNYTEEPTKIEPLILHQTPIPDSNRSLLVQQNSYATNTKLSTDDEIGFNPPKVYLNKEKIKQLNALKDEVNIILKNCNNKGNFAEPSKLLNEPVKNIATNNITYEETYDNTQNGDNLQLRSSSSSHYQPSVIKTNEPSELKTIKTSAVKASETSSQVQYKEFLKQRNFSVIKTNPEANSATDSLSPKQPQNVIREQPSKQSNSPRHKLSNVNTTTEKFQQSIPQQLTTKATQMLQPNSDNFNTNLHLESTRQLPNNSQNATRQSVTNVNPAPISPTGSQFQSFLKELQETINAGATKEKSEIKCTPGSEKTNCPKQIIQQKRVDNAPNTFSRLSYLHKNKQNDNKHKVMFDQAKPSQTISLEDKQNLGLNHEKVNYLQSKGEIVISRIDKTKNNLNENAKVIVQKVQNFKCLPSTRNTPLCLNKQYPIISNMLKSENRNLNTKTLNENDNKSIQPINTVTPVTSNFPTENDQKDLLLLSRQQSKMNPLKQHKAETPKIIVDCFSIASKDTKATIKPNNNNTQFNDAHNVNRTIQTIENSKHPPDVSSLAKVSNNKASSSVSELKKVRPVKSSGKSSKQPLKSNESSDWESVMNALLAQKTPSRGPNALDIALKKDSFEKRSNKQENENIKTTQSNTSNTSRPVDYANPKESPCRNNSVLINSGNVMLTDTPTVSPNLKQKYDKKAFCKDIELDRNSPLDFNDKHFAGVIQNTNDPFISGIPNSDYDLLEELMDDDLRKEIGEIMFDEEAYGGSAHIPKTRHSLYTKPANSFVNKYPGHKLNSLTFHKPQTANSCQNMDHLQNKNIILPTKDSEDFPPRCLHKPVVQSKSNAGALNGNNVSKKPRIISNELIMSSLEKQSSNLKQSNNPNKTAVATENSNFSSLNIPNRPTVNNATASSNTFGRVCSTHKFENGAAIEIQTNNVDNIYNNQNIVVDPTKVVLTVPQRSVTPNMMLIRNDMICDPYSTIQIDPTNRNAYVSVNQARNLTLYRTTQFVAPCANPALIEHANTLPVIHTVSPNIIVNLSSNTAMATQNPETKNTTTSVKLNQDNKIKTEEARVCNKNYENDISKIINKSPEIIKSTMRPNIVKNLESVACLSQSDVELSNKKLIPDSKKININVTMQNVCDKSNVDIKHVSTETIKPVITSKIAKIITPSPDKETSSLLGKDIEPKINDPVKSNLDTDEQCEIKKNQERLQLKRMKILNRQISHRCYDKPISLTYKPIHTTQEVFKPENPREEITLQNYSNKTNMVMTNIPKNDSDKIIFNEKQSNVPSKFNENQSSLNSCQNVLESPAKESENSSAMPCRRILLRSSNIIKDMTTLKSIKGNLEGFKANKKPKQLSLSSKRPSILKPVINKILKTKPAKPIKVLKSSTFEKLTNNTTKVQKSCVKNFETKVITSELPTVNKDKSCMEKTNFTCIDIEEQITSARIPNIFKEIHNKQTEILPEINQNTVLKQNVTEKHTSEILCYSDSHKSKEVKDLHIVPKNVNSLKSTTEKNIDKGKCKRYVVELNNIASILKPVSTVSKNIPNSGVTSLNLKENSINSIINSAKSDNCKEQEKSNQIVPKVMPSKVCSENQPETLNKETSTNTSDNIVDFKNKVTFEEIPSYNNDPLKKCVRIKLPNGNTFKATISGKLSVDVDSLFEDPKIKALLWKNIKNNTKCTLNIKQVAVKNSNQSHTVMTKVHDISFTKPIIDSETINLISDDEEDPIQTFKTEYGSYNIASMNPDMFIKHQKRLFQKCVVKIERLSLLEDIPKPNDSDNLNAVDLINENSSLSKASDKPSALFREEFTSTNKINETSSLPKKLDITKLQLTDELDTVHLIDERLTFAKNINLPKTPQDLESLNLIGPFNETPFLENITDFVEIDDSSIESDINNIAPGPKLTEDVDDSKIMLLKDNKLKKSCDDESLSIVNLLDKIITGNEIQSKECLLKIEKCDDLVNKMNISKKLCFVSLVRCDDSGKGPENLDLLTDSNLVDKSQPLLEIKLPTPDENSVFLGNDNNCSTLKRRGSISILNEFLPSDGNKYIQREKPLKSYGYELRKEQCDADWFTTKTNLRRSHLDYINSLHNTTFETDDKVIRYDDVSTDCDSDVEACSPVNKQYLKNNETYSLGVINYEVPSLLKLTVSYFANNSNLIENLRPSINLIDKTVTSSSPLKRKITDIMDTKDRTKISKTENFSSLLINDETEKKAFLKINKDSETISLHHNQQTKLAPKENDSTRIKQHDSFYENENEKNNENYQLLKLNSNSTKSNNIIPKISFQQDLNETLKTKLKDNNMKQSNVSQPDSFFIDKYNFDDKNNSTKQSKVNTHLSGVDEIEVILPLEELDVIKTESIQADATHTESCSSEKHSVSAKNIKNNVNKLDVNNFHEVAHNVQQNYSNAKVSISKCTHNDNSETLLSSAKVDNSNKIDDAQMYHASFEKGESLYIKTNEDKASSANGSCKSELSTNASDNSFQKNVTLVYNGDSSVVLKGSIYEDPIVGTCYVFPILNRTSCSDEVQCNNVCDENTINVIQALKTKVFEDNNAESDEKENSNNLNFAKPKITYSRQGPKKDLCKLRITEKMTKKSLKRKIETNDNKLTEKRYRKGKNIDYPKITVTAMAESAYSKEYKRLFNYCSSIKFSFSRPFHKEYIDVSGVLKCWPIKEASNNSSDKTDCKSVLFLDENIEKKGPYDPLQQTLAEEISSNYTEQQSPGEQINESNFSMGFGERSGRVINFSEDGDNISKFSAATLSDVKQSQPFLLSEDYDDYDKCQEICNSKNDQIDIFKRCVSFIQLRDKVRSFFRKTTLELNYHWLNDNLNSCKRSVYNSKYTSDFPYDLVSPDFIEPAPIETVVQVVQVGQLPVSAAAQNPVTCDPRVTQVTDASPSQCSAENSPLDDSQPAIKTEYTELTTADLSLPLAQEYERHMKSQESSRIPICNENIPVQMEITEVIKEEIKDEPIDYNDNDDLETLVNNHINNVEYSYDSNENNSSCEAQPNDGMMFNHHQITETLNNHNSDFIAQQKQQNGSTEKTDQIAHAMNAAGITTTPEVISNQEAHNLVNIMSPKVPDATSPAQQTNNYSKPAINAMSLQQALAQILPPPLNQTNAQENNQTASNSSVTSQVLHIVQGKNTNGNQITLVDNTHNTVINSTNTPVLHIVQNKGVNNNSTTNANPGQHSTSYGGISLVDAGLQQGNNQLLHIVNTGSQKNPATGQLLKRVNLLTNLTNAQGNNEQKMVQFLCKAADGKSIQLNASHQRSMVLRLQPIESNIQGNQKETPDLSPSTNTNVITSNKETTNGQQEIKSRSVYEENYAKFIQNSTNKSVPEKSTSLPKFNQAFGKQVYQDGSQKSNDINSNTSHLSSVNLSTESAECQSSDNAMNLDHIGQINSPPLLLRKGSGQTTQTPSVQANLMQHIKQTISPMNIQTMHGGVIYTRQIPVNIGGGQTINLITVPSTELIDENNQKHQNEVKFVNQNEMESPIIKIVPQSQVSNADGSSDENISHTSSSNENSQNTTSQHQPVLTQMRIKLPMLSKAPQMVAGTRVVRPSFFQIQRNVIGGANQPVYQQLVLTAAPPLGQHTIRLPQAQTTRQVKVSSENQSSPESQMSSSTLEQLREFDMVLEQVKERSTVQPNTNANTAYTKLSTPSSDTTDSTSITSTVTESTQKVLYSIGSNQSVNVAYVTRKPSSTPSTSQAFVRSPDSSGIIESPSSSTHAQIPHTVTSESSSSEGTSQSSQPKAAKIGSKSKSRPKSSHSSSAVKINTTPPKTSTQKPMEDEQTTQRILYILAEYKEQVENSPDKDKPAPRRRSNPPTNPSGSSKRKKSSSGSRRPGTRDMSPIHGDESCRTMGSEDSSCGTSQGDCNESCHESHSPQDSPRKVVRKLSFENETNRPRPQPQRNVIVADGQTITVARGTAGKPTTAVLMPANYILPVSMVKGGQQIAIVTNRGPKILTVGGGEGGATNALLLQRLIGPAGLKPVLARPGIRHVRLPTAALHNLQAFNLATATTVQPPDSTASPAPAQTPPELVETRTDSSPWTDRESQDVKPERGSSPEDTEPWHLATSADPNDYSYEETVRTENMDRTVLDAIPDRYSPEMEAQRIFDKMFDVDSKKSSYIVDSQDDSRCAYDIDASDSDDKAYHQVVQRKDGGSHRHHRLSHVSAAALRHKYAILEHELRLQGTAFLQKSLSEECEDLGVDSPSASELFPEAELLFGSSPAHEAAHHSHTPQPTILNQSIPQPDIDDQIATDRLLQHEGIDDQQDLGVTLGLDEGIVTVSEDGMQATIALDQEEFARSHPNTTFHSEPTEEGEVQPFTITGLRGRHITSTIFHAGRAPATVLVTAPQATVISQATPGHGIHNNVKFANINQIINSTQATHGNLNLSSVVVKDDGLTKYDGILTDSRELHLSNTASAIIHSTGNATQVIRRVRYEDDKRDARYIMDEPEGPIAGDDAKMVAEDSSGDATLESIAGDADDDSLPERHAELFWESNSASERSDGRRPLDFSSDSERCCKSPSYDEANSTDSGGLGAHVRLDSVIKDARGLERSASADGSSDDAPPLRTYPARRAPAPRSVSGKTRAGCGEPEGRRRASGRGVVKRGCHCCGGEPAPPRAKRPRPRRPAVDFCAD